MTFYIVLEVVYRRYYAIEPIVRGSGRKMKDGKKKS